MFRMHRSQSDRHPDHLASFEFEGTQPQVVLGDCRPEGRIAGVPFGNGGHGFTGDYPMLDELQWGLFRFRRGDFNRRGFGRGRFGYDGQGFLDFGRLRGRRPFGFRCFRGRGRAVRLLRQRGTLNHRFGRFDGGLGRSDGRFLERRGEQGQQAGPEQAFHRGP